MKHAAFFLAFCLFSICLAADQGPAPENLRLRALTGTLPAQLEGNDLGEGGWILIQFESHSSDHARRSLLKQLGAPVGASIPSHTLLARVPAASLPRLRTHPDVIWIGRFHPAYKLAGPLGEVVQAERLRVSAAPGLSTGDLQEAIETAGATALEAWSGGAIISAASEQTVINLARNASVLFIEPAVDARLFNDSSRGICQSSSPGNDTIHARGIRGMNQTVAVMDSGIDTGHCCFGDGKIVSNTVWGGGKLGALCGGDHGTHVSGTVSCLNAGDHDGLAPDAQLIMQDIQGDGSFACLFGSISPPGNLFPSWDAAYGAGARVHTNSWGGGGNSYGGDSQSIDDYMWQHQDFLIVYAAGNSGPGAGSLGAYTNAKNSITVGGTVNGASHDDMYNSSSRGPAADGRTLPDLLSPGQGVSSALNNINPTCGWRTYSGTSMAAPSVAGSAALVREYYERGFYPSGAISAVDGFSASAALVKATMLISTRNMTGSGTGGDRPNSDQGFGRVTLDDALWFDDEAPLERLQMLDDLNMNTGLSNTGEEHSFELGLRSTAPVKIMLTWTDAPGSPSAQKALVNDLDLAVTLADGRVFRGNQGFEVGWTTQPATETDDLNNKEAVFFESPAPGPVTITVRATTIGNVALHPQDYALVVVADSDPSCSPDGSASGVGNSVTLAAAGDDLKATWTDSTGESYAVYRGTTPDFMKTGPSTHADQIQDEDPGTGGIQWTDQNVISDGNTYYYVTFARNSCEELLP